MAAKKIIRVLVYEGDDEALRQGLLRRAVKGQRVEYNGTTITETFVDADAVRAWLGEQVSEEDMASAIEVVDLNAPAPGMTAIQVATMLQLRANELASVRVDGVKLSDAYGHQHVVIDGSMLRPPVNLLDVACQFCLAGVGELCAKLSTTGRAPLSKDEHHYARLLAWRKANGQ